MPLDFQPGTEWRYSSLAGMETLGRIVEVASGLTFDQFLKQRIFDPLGMKDTGFFPTDDKLPRVATLYGRQDGVLAAGRNAVVAGHEDAVLRRRRTLVHARGLPAVRADARERRSAERQAVCSVRRTVDLMGSNHLGDLYARGGRPGMGWGLSVEVVVDPVAANRRTSAGSFGWDGAFGTHFWVDRKEQITGILLIQQGVQAQLNRDFENAVMQAIID